MPDQQNVSLSLTLASKYIPVNANKDNGSAWKPGLDFIPTVRDFEVETPINVEDQQLIRATVTITGGLAGTLEVDSYNPGDGVLRFWTNRKKAASFGSIQIAAGKNPATVSFYVEGVHESQALDDTFIDLVFTPTNGTPVTLRKEVTVTPVITSFTADIPTPSVSFLNRPEGEEPNGLKGLAARKPPDQAGGTPTNGIKLTAEIVNGPITMKFLQNVMNVQNGANGSAAGFVLVGNAKKNVMIKPALNTNFPLLDAVPGGNSPFYPESSVVVNQGVRITMGDSPSSTLPTQAENEQVEIIDVMEFFRAHVVATYSDGTIYPIAYRDWTVNFYATDRVATLGVSKINPASKVEAAADWSRSNADPAKTKPPVFNGSIVVQ